MLLKMFIRRTSPKSLVLTSRLKEFLDECVISRTIVNRVKIGRVCVFKALVLSFLSFPLRAPLLNGSCVSSVCEYLISFHLNHSPSLSSDAEDVFDGLCLRALDAQDVSLDKDLKSQYQIMPLVDT